MKERGQATIGEIKELNLGTEKEPHPIYVSIRLMPKEEEEYFILLFEYEDVFTLSYKKTPRLDPMVAIHSLSIKKGVSLKGILNGLFAPDLC